MALSRRFFLAGTIGFGVVACGPSFNREAGIGIDEGGFGNPTMNNTLLQSGEISLAKIMTRRFHAEVPSMVNFAFDSSSLDAEAHAVLKHQAHWMKQFPELRYKIYGHTDTVGSEAYNMRLGQRRANTVMRQLIHLGVPSNSILAVVSRGETQPLIAADGYEPANRRTVTEIVGVVRRAQRLDGEYAHLVHREYVASAGSTSGNASQPSLPDL